MANQTTLTFAGDADSLRRATAQATEGLDDVAAAATEASGDMAAASADGQDLTTRMGHLGSAVDGATTALDSIGGSLQAVADIQQMTARRADDVARKLLDVEQAAGDLDQAYGDLKQAQLDLSMSFLDAEQGTLNQKLAINDAKQAALDATVAQTEYNDAVKEFGKGSAEAQQALIDVEAAQLALEQANIDGKVAVEEVKQANEDGSQAYRDMGQATRDARGAQLDLNEATRAAHPPELQKWADNLQMVTPLITAAVGIIGLVTAAQWLWNASLWASPVTWIVLAVAAVVAGIVILAMHTKELGEIWDAVWKGISAAASWTWGVIKAGANAFWNHLKEVWAGVTRLPGQLGDAFSKIGGYIVAPFKWAFNTVSDAWNATIGRLHWTVPGWVPGIGGNSISAPRLSRYHTGGIVPGGLGAESLAVLQAGERVTAGTGHSEGRTVTLNSDGSALDDWILDSVRRAVGLRGGDPVVVLGGSRG